MEKFKQAMETLKAAWDKVQAAKPYALPLAYAALGFLAAKLLSC